MDLDTQVKLVIYWNTAERGEPPVIGEVAKHVGRPVEQVRESYGRLARNRLLVLEPDGETIRMAPPFSGVPTQHRVTAAGVSYYANCAWDALGIPAALNRPAEVVSRCEQSKEALRLTVGLDGPEPSSWLFHCEVPAAKWWKDIVFT
ncbi:MAG TPA: organomercurial lyase [Gemmatimonadales bacterium]